MAQYIITYDLDTTDNKNRSQDYSLIIEYIEKKLRGKFLLKSVYLVESDLSAKTIFIKFPPTINIFSSDKILIVPIREDLELSKWGIDFIFD